MSDTLSSLKVGHEVPWVTSWTGEVHLGIGRCFTVSGRPALGQADAPGLGKPQYSKNHLVRQRLSVIRMLCPMCGEATAEDDRWTQVAKPVAAGALRRKGLALPADIYEDHVLLDAGAIAPLHKRCVDRSLRHCPHLRASPDVRVRRFPPIWTVIPLLIDADEIAGRRPKVVGFLQLCGVTRTIDRRWRLTKPQTWSSPRSLIVSPCGSPFRACNLDLACPPHPAVEARLSMGICSLWADRQPGAAGHSREHRPHTTLGHKDPPPQRLTFGAASTIAPGTGLASTTVKLRGRASWPKVLNLARFSEGRCL